MQAAVALALLMAYGGQDLRVSVDHGAKLRDALSPRNANLEWVVYTHEGHGWMLQENILDFWTRVELFLDRHLKAAP